MKTPTDNHLIRKSETQANETFHRLKAELAYAFAAPEGAYKSISAIDVIARNRKSP